MKLDIEKYPIFKHQKLSGNRREVFVKERITNLAVVFLSVLGAFGVSILVYDEVNLSVILGIVALITITYTLIKYYQGKSYWQLRKEEKRLQGK